MYGKQELYHRQTAEKIKILEKQKEEKEKEKENSIYILGNLIISSITDNKAGLRKSEEGILFLLSNQQSKEIEESICCIHKIKKEIEKLEENIVAYKNIYLCPDCGRENDKNATFCRFCGCYLKVVKIDESTEADSCANCGFILEEDAKYCPNCGKRINKPKSSIYPKVKKCKSCGNILSDDAIFCNECGTQYYASE